VVKLDQTTLMCPVSYVMAICQYQTCKPWQKEPYNPILGEVSYYNRVFPSFPALSSTDGLWGACTTTAGWDYKTLGSHVSWWHHWFWCFFFLIQEIWEWNQGTEPGTRKIIGSCFTNDSMTWICKIIEPQHLFAFSITPFIFGRFWEHVETPNFGGSKLRFCDGSIADHEDLPGNGRDNPEWLRHRLLPEAPVGCVQGAGFHRCDIGLGHNNS